MPVSPNLLTNDQIKQIGLEEVTDIFKKHMNPGQYRVLKLLGFHKVLIKRAEGMFYVDSQDRRILDFFGSFGAMCVGHNHKRILSARQEFQKEQRHEMGLLFLSQYSAALSKNLAMIAPDPLEMVMLSNSGSEAVEAALKLAEQYQGGKRAKIIYAENSFHGKTRGALSITDSKLYRSEFKLLPNTTRVPFGDFEALEELIGSDPSVGILVLETIQGGAGIICPPEGYFQSVRKLCDEKKIVWIADEVQCGMGRTGRFFAFEEENVVPDIVTLAKGLGGGKAAIGATIASKEIYMKAYGSAETALIHGPSTFSGMGEACCTAIETLNVIYDESLLQNAEDMGNYLLDKFKQLQKKHNKFIKEVRGRGLMVGIEFCDFSKTLPLGVEQLLSGLDERLKGSLCGFVGSLLLKEYDILIAFTEYNRNVIRLEPPLCVTKEHIDQLVDAMDNLLSKGISRIIMKYVAQFMERDR